MHMLIILSAFLLAAATPFQFAPGRGEAELSDEVSNTDAADLADGADINSDDDGQA